GRTIAGSPLRPRRRHRPPSGTDHRRAVRRGTGRPGAGTASPATAPVVHRNGGTIHAIGIKGPGTMGPTTTTDRVTTDPRGRVHPPRRGTERPRRPDLSKRGVHPASCAR